MQTHFRARVKSLWQNSAVKTLPTGLYMQDGRMITKGLYRFYLYDDLSRVVVEGTCSSCNRVVVDSNDSIVQTTHYYPFGAVYADAGRNPSFQKYKYTGKELDLVHGLNTYDHGARQSHQNGEEVLP